MLILEATHRTSRQAVQFSLPQTIGDIKLKRFIEYQNTIALKKPATMQAYQDATEEERIELLATFSPTEISVVWMEWLYDFAKFWTGLSEEMIAQLREEEIHFIHKVVNTSIDEFRWNETKDSIQLGEEKYYYPPAPVNPLVNQVEFMKGSRIIDTLEALQFEMYWKQLGESKWAVLPHIIAILCKRQGEELPLKSLEREKFIAQRAKEFEQLPLDEALNLAFFLSSRKHTYQKDLSLFLTLKQKGFAIPEGFSFGKNMDFELYLKELQRANSFYRRVFLPTIAHKWQSVTKHLTGLVFKMKKTFT